MLVTREAMAWLASSRKLPDDGRRRFWPGQETRGKRCSLGGDPPGWPNEAWALPWASRCPQRDGVTREARRCWRCVIRAVSVVHRHRRGGVAGGGPGVSRSRIRHVRHARHGCVLEFGDCSGAHEHGVRAGSERAFHRNIEQANNDQQDGQ